MNQISPDQLLSQIRTMSRQLQTPTVPTQTAAPSGPEFGDLLRNTLDSVNKNQEISRDLKVGFERGTEDNLVKVMIASEKANLSFRAVTEVRNKLVTAYQDIMNMPV